jgi:hypothetical protein
MYKRAVLPKTAKNFLNMQKGLYMKTLQTPSHVINRNRINKSLNTMLNAYGELMITEDETCDSVKFERPRRLKKPASYNQ